MLLSILILKGLYFTQCFRDVFYFKRFTLYSEFKFYRSTLLRISVMKGVLYSVHILVMPDMLSLLAVNIEWSVYALL